MPMQGSSPSREPHRAGRTLSKGSYTWGGDSGWERIGIDRRTCTRGTSIGPGARETVARGCSVGGGRRTWRCYVSTSAPMMWGADVVACASNGGGRLPRVHPRWWRPHVLPCPLVHAAASGRCCPNIIQLSSRPQTELGCAGRMP